MNIERYIIELENGNFAKLEQVSEREILVYDYRDPLSATHLYKGDAEDILKEMLEGHEYWEYDIPYKPKRIRKITAILEEINNE